MCGDEYVSWELSLSVVVHYSAHVFSTFIRMRASEARSNQRYMKCDEYNKSIDSDSTVHRWTVAWTKNFQQRRVHVDDDAKKNIK